MKNALKILPGVIAAVGLATAASAQESYIADMTGAAEVPGPGDPGGAGIATLDWSDLLEQMCFALSIDDIDLATAAHVHRGAAGVTGPPVITLETPGADGGSDGCVDITPDLRTEIRANPGAFYVNVHTGPHPAGAVRGQLER